jgi:hypothetical protein
MAAFVAGAKLRVQGCRDCVNGDLGYANSPGSVGACGPYAISTGSAYIINDCGGDIRGNPTNGGLCSGTAPNPGQCGPLEAAVLWDLAAADVAALQSAYGSLGSRPTAVAALTQSSAQHVGYANSYFNQMIITLGQHPSYWAVHDYDDPTSTAAATNGCGAT